MVEEPGVLLPAVVSMQVLPSTVSGVMGGDNGYAGSLEFRRMELYRSVSSGHTDIESRTRSGNVARSLHFNE